MVKEPADGHGRVKRNESVERAPYKPKGVYKANLSLKCVIPERPEKPCLNADDCSCSKKKHQAESCSGFGCHGCEATPNDPKLSDGGARRGTCMVGGRRRRKQVP